MPYALLSPLACLVWQFSSYHVLANLPLRYVRSTYKAGYRRTALEWMLVLAMSYAMAFMETLTISNFPYYDFEDRAMAYTVGSAFYGLYFVVSFPVYFALDEPGARPLFLSNSNLSSLLPHPPPTSPHR